MISPPGIWAGVLRRLEAKLPSYALQAWVQPLTAESDGEGIRLVCPSPFHRDRIRDRFLPLIHSAAAEEAGRPVGFALAVSEGRSLAADDPEPPRPGPDPQARRSGVERPSQQPFPYTFETFVVGPCNALAREASFAIAHGRQQRLNPLYLVSQPGLGKTHLARAIVTNSTSGDSRCARYAPAESFTNEFMASIRSREMDRFKRRFRTGCNLLVVEDVQFLASKTATQMELFHTIAHLLDAGVRVVLTGDRLPRDIANLEPRLRSQMTAGLVAEIDPPDTQVRSRILRSKAASGGVHLPDDCLGRLVEVARGSVRDLEGVLIQLVASSSLLGRPIDLDLTEAALHKLSPTQPAAPVLELRAIVEAVASFFRTTPEAMASRSRRRDVLVPRQLAMYLCRRYSDAPLTAIARAFGRDHPAVSNAVRVVERRILEHAPLRYQIEALSARLDALQRRSGRISS
jgi:chromosomal replication initiator protein